MSRMIPWKTPIQASWVRSLELSSFEYKTKDVVLRVLNDDDSTSWNLTFQSVQGFKMTTFECASAILQQTDERGATFEVPSSPWIDELGRGRVRFLDESKHFVVCCYDDVIEVVAHRVEIIQT